MWMANKNYMVIIREEDKFDHMGSKLTVFPYNDTFHITLVTTIKTDHEMEQFQKNIPHFEKFLKYRIE